MCLISVISFLITINLFIKSYQGYAYSYIPISEINKICAKKQKELIENQLLNLLANDTILENQEAVNELKTKIMSDEYRRIFIKTFTAING